MREPMGTTKATKATATKAPPARTRSLLVEAGDAAMRKLLLATLRKQRWNLTATATALRMTGPSNVLHAVKRLGLTTELDAARVAGKVSPGSRTA